MQKTTENKVWVTGMIVGYARVSTEDQKVDLQLRALEGAGCERIYVDQGRSGADFHRNGLERALRRLKPNDTLVVWRLDRLGRSLTGLVKLMDQLGKRSVHFRSLNENINTATSGGRLMFHVFAALAEFERAVISERTRAGLSAARARGKKLGRPHALTPAQISQALEAVGEGNAGLQDLATELGVSVRTLYRYLRPVTEETEGGRRHGD